MQINRFSQLILVAFFALYSCSTSKKNVKTKQINSTLDGQWILEKIADQPIGKVIDVPTVQIDFENKSINGQDGCNSFFGTIDKLTNNEIELKTIGATERWCEPMDIPDQFNEAFQLVRNYNCTENTLTFLSSEKQPLLYFVRQFSQK